MPAADGSESTIAETTSYCNMCRKWKPIDEFRFRNREKNERHPQCNACLAGYQRGYRDNKRKRQLKKYVDELATDPSDPGSLGAKTRTDAVLKAMLLRFGGLERFADDWFQFLRVAAVAGKHHVLQRSFEALLRLMELADRSQQDSQKREPATDEELREFIIRELVHNVWREPDVGIVALEALGFKVEPPDEPLPAESLDAACDVVRQRPGLFAYIGDGRTKEDESDYDCQRDA
jgi:hypothetical protein